MDKETQRGPRVALVGPLPPLRGGIPRHTAALRDALGLRSQLLTIPLRRLYPRWLFPGASPYEPAMGGRSAPVPPGVDALAPWAWRGALRRLRSHGAERVVMPWWTVAVAPALWTIARGARRRGIPVTFLCHNVVDHEDRWWKRVVTRRVLSQGDQYVVASRKEAARLGELLDRPRVRVHPHPVYPAFPTPTEPLPRRAARELLFFGLIRPYKGLDVLIEALTRLSESDWHLTVAGEPWQDLAPLRARAARAGIEQRIEWLGRYVPADIAGALFDRADVLVLPYTHATGCGVLAHAIGAGKPVIASDLPGLQEQVRHGETGWLVEPGDAAALADAISGLDSRRAAAMEDAVRALSQRWTWSTLADTVLADV